MNIVQTSRTVGLSIGLIAASAVLMPIGASSADLYVSTYRNGVDDGKINKITSDGVVTTFASGYVSANAGIVGFATPSGLAFDTNGNLFVADMAKNLIIKIRPDGFASTFSSAVTKPFGLAIDSSNNLFVSSGGIFSNVVIKKITPNGVDSIFSSFSDIHIPNDLEFDKNGNLFASIHGSNNIRKITTDGIVSTFASGIGSPYGLAFDSMGNLFVSNVDTTGRIKKITPSGVVSTFASGFSNPASMTIDESDNLILVESATTSIKKITPTGIISNYATGINGALGLAFAPTSSTSTAVPEPFTIIGTLIGGTAALRMRKKLKSSGKE